MIKLLIIIKTSITYILWAFIAFFCFALCVPLACLPARIRYDNRLYFAVTTLVAQLTIAASFIKISIKGARNPPNYPNTPAIFVINHTSALDIALVEMLAGSYPHIWISKASYTKIPFFGFLLKRMHILVERENQTKAGRAFLKAYQLAKDKARHMLIFPEGTRHNDGKLHTFHPGFALLAQKLNRPVIPVIITGAQTIFPKKSFLVDSSACHVKISIGKPIYYTHEQSQEDFIKLVHDYCKQELETLNKQ